MLAQPAGAPEALRLEHRERPVVQERRGGRAALAVLRIALDAAAAQPGDLVHRAGQRGGGDTAAPVLPVDEEAGDPPIRKRVEVALVRAPVLDARQFPGRPELAP